LSVFSTPVFGIDNLFPAELIPLTPSSLFRPLSLWFLPLFSKKPVLTREFSLLFQARANYEYGRTPLPHKVSLGFSILECVPSVHLTPSPCSRPFWCTPFPPTRVFFFPDTPFDHRITLLLSPRFRALGQGITLLSSSPNPARFPPFPSDTTNTCVQLT